MLCHQLTTETDVVRELPAYIEDAHIVIIPYPRAFSNFMFNVPGDTIIIIYFSQLKYIIYNTYFLVVAYPTSNYNFNRNYDYCYRFIFK